MRTILTAAIFASSVLCAFFAPLRTARALTASAGETLPYEKIAKDFATARGIDTAHPETIKLDDVLAKHFVQARLGIFDTRFPVTGLEKSAETFKSCATALLAAEEKWLDWLQATGVDQKALRDDLKTLSAWVKGWKAPALAHPKNKDSVDLYAMLGAPDNVIEASKRLADALGKGLDVGPAREVARSVRLIFAPTRKDFCELVFFTGWILPDQRGTYWLEGVPSWGLCFLVGDQLIPLEYASNDRAAMDYTKGTAMGEILPQQVMQLALNSLFTHYYGERVPGEFLSGLSMNLVIDACGEINTRIDGDTRGKTTRATEVFVPGGQSEGGVLPKNSAETKWRENGGKDHFVPTLRASQKEGGDLAKDAKNKLACFAIRSDAGGEKWAASAPLLGSAAASAKTPAKEFQGDFAEFVRAYKSTFIFWLQTKSQANEKASRERFSTLLRKLADPNMQSGFEEVFKTVYDGAPLSAPEAAKESLEGKFLIWLSKQKS